MLKQVSTYRKAIVAGVTGLVGSFVTALADGDLTGPEIITAVLTAIVAALGTYNVVNETPEVVE